MQRSQLPPNRNDDPLEALCRLFNVVRKTHPPGQPLPATLDMDVIQDAHMPTHVLAVVDATETAVPHPLLVPIHADLFRRRFRIDILPTADPGSTVPVPYPSPVTNSLIVSLPVVLLQVPHPPSVPLLLLFAIHPGMQSNMISWRLLPQEVIEEFPSAAAMAQVMAQECSDERLRSYVAFNQGLWKNLLALGLRSATITGIVQTAWNVTAEARRMRLRQREYERAAANGIMQE